MLQVAETMKPHRATKTREELVQVARHVARGLLPNVERAKRAAFEAIRLADPLTGTSTHPHAAYAHGIAQLAHEGVELAMADRLAEMAGRIRR